MEFNIRPYHRRDLESLKAITVEGFEGVSLDHAIERVLDGEFAGRDWRWRMARHVDEDVVVFAEGVFVAEANGAVAGYYWSTRWRFSGRRNWSTLQYKRWPAIRWGIRFHPSCGFQEVAARFTSRSGFNYLIRRMRMLRRTP